MSQRDNSNPVRAIRLARGESLAEFGRVLAKLVGRRMPYDRSHISKLESGQDAITPQVARALEILGALLDGVSELQASARTYTVLATHELPAKTIVLGKPKSCGLPGCQIVFVPASPHQIYCSPDCRKSAAKLRKGSCNVPPTRTT